MLVIELKKDDIIVRKWSIFDIEEAVYTLTQLVPIGCTTTYKDLAKVLGISPRLVAKILSRNKSPIAIPCHRVVKADGSLGGYTLYGKRALEFKGRLLSLENLHELCKYSISELLEIG